jgi:hypothetical protein
MFDLRFYVLGQQDQSTAAFVVIVLLALITTVDGRFA